MWWQLPQGLPRAREWKPFRARRYSGPSLRRKASTTDYVTKYGFSSWELDALEPAILADLIEEETLALRNEDEWIKAVEQERIHTAELEEIARLYDDVVKFLMEA